MEKQLEKRSSKKLSKTIKVETLKKHSRENRKKSKWKKDEDEHRNEDGDSRDKSKDEDLSSEENYGSSVSHDEFATQEEMVRNLYWKIGQYESGGKCDF